MLHAAAGTVGIGDGCLLYTSSVGQGTYHEAGAVGGIACHEYVLCKLRLLGLEETHGKKHHIGLSLIHIFSASPT